MKTAHRTTEPGVISDLSVSLCHPKPLIFSSLLTISLLERTLSNICLALIGYRTLKMAVQHQCHIQGE